MYLKDVRKSARYKLYLPDSFGARTRGLEFPFVELVEDYKHATPAEQMARQQLREDFLGMRRSYMVLEGVRGYPTKKVREAAIGGSKRILPEEFMLRVKAGQERSSAANQKKVWSEIRRKTSSRRRGS